MNKAFEKILERLDEMIHPKGLYFCKYAQGGCRHLHNDEKDCMECVVELAKEIVQEVAEEYKGGWIPCSERLPEESLNSVIGWDEYRQRCCFVQYYGGRWILGNDIDSVKIIAWQPLPEPFKERDK